MTFHARAAVPVLLLSSLALTGCSLFQQPVGPGPVQPTEEPAVVDITDANFGDASHMAVFTRDAATTDVIGRFTQTAVWWDAAIWRAHHVLLHDEPPPLAGGTEDDHAQERKPLRRVELEGFYDLEGDDAQVRHDVEDGQPGIAE